MVERTSCSSSEEASENVVIGIKISDPKNFVRDDDFAIVELANPTKNRRRDRSSRLIRDKKIDVTIESTRLESNSSNCYGEGSNSTSKFSLFKWFKRGSRDLGSSTDRRRRRKRLDVGSGSSADDEYIGAEEEEEEETRNVGSSSGESSDTVYSTATVKSFDFHSGTLRSYGEETRLERESPSILGFDDGPCKLGPFGTGAAKLVVNKDGRRNGGTVEDVTRTLPVSVVSRRRDITARYSLQTSGGFGSCGNFGGSRGGLTGSLRRLDDRNTVRRVHVRGKRRAPNPPLPCNKPKFAINDEDAKISRPSGRKKRRPAPKPPERRLEISDIRTKTINANDEFSRIRGVANDDEESQRFDDLDTGSEVDNEDPRKADTSVGNVAKSTNLVTTDATISEKTVCKLVETFENIVGSKTEDSETKVVGETSSGLTTANCRSDVINFDQPESISNDTLVLQGGVLHSKRELETSLTLKSGSTNVSTDANARDAKLRSSVGDCSIKTGSQTSAMPRPWYKRSVFENNRDTGSAKRGEVLKNSTTQESREEIATGTNVSSCSTTKTSQTEKSPHEGGTLSRLNFFHRSDKNSDERKKENKRKSGLSILTNISELDKEAAAIVQEEQARTRAASMLLQASRIGDVDRRTDHINEEVVQEIVTSAMESSPRRGTRALISKFNAIGNITKVTVNTSFFARSACSKERKDANTEIGSKICENVVNDDWRSRTNFRGSESPQSVVKVEKDLSRYFLHQQIGTRTKTSGDVETKLNSRESPKISRTTANVSTRMSFFQSTGIGTRDTEIEASRGAPISRFNDAIVGPGDKDKPARKIDTENSPKFTRLRVNVVNSDVGKSCAREIGEVKKIVEQESGKSGEDLPTRKDVEIVGKEFTNIFKEIDGKIGTRSFDDSIETGSNNENKTQEPGTSSRVSRVLDILVEAEKIDRSKTNRSTSRQIDVIENSDISDKFGKNLNSKFVENPMKMDLREMLKEMKHSLPKRPKAKKNLIDREIAEKSEKIDREETKTIVRVPIEDAKTESKHLMNSVTVIYPPPIRIGPPTIIGTKKNGGPKEERDFERSKVSSAAQTSGNVRKVKSGSSSSDSTKWKQDDVVYRTSGKGVATPGTSGGLVKNTFQLIRPREFAQIEAIKTMKPTNVENTYANVIERESLYANCPVTAVKRVPRGLPVGPKKDEEKTIEESAKIANERTSMKKIVDDKLTKASMESNDETADVRTAVDQQNMNTLAVNRLLRRLEAAIASGHHQQAAGLAKELARLKIHCSVVRQRTKAKDVINVNMYIEDKLAHQGPIPLRLARSMTVAQLKAKVFTEFEIPTNVQRWIVGKNLADDDATTLEGLQAGEGSPVFLYLVAPELKVEEPSGRVERLAVVDDALPKEPDPKPLEEIVTVVAIEEKSAEEQAQHQSLREEEEEEEDEEEEECISEEVRMERYEALISLENCDVIPNSEPIECPICFVTYGPQEGVILRDCLHMFCRPCIANTIRYCEEAEVKCPYRDTQYTCESTLQEREIKALVETEIYQQHLAKSIAQAENNAGNNSFHCKTPDCPGWCIYDDNVNNFLCPVCGVNNCLTCQVVHTGKNCRQYQQELRLSKETDQESKRTAAMLEEMVDRGEALPCPTCAVVLMKKWGCDWLRCSMCKTEICWVTRGPRWGPGGKGDTSGGCRCGENGVKCHPRCNYCH